MKLIFIYGPPASGKLTVARELARITGLPVFHNHLIVDAVAAVFPFGSDQFVRLREQMWLSVMREAAATGRSLIFTFAPEPTVTGGFPERVLDLVQAAGGATMFVQLRVPIAEQEKRLTAASRAEFGKLQSLEILRSLRDQFELSERAMPTPQLIVDTSMVEPSTAARNIASAFFSA
ncbi:AAA family ATPase [Variovorax sp. DT-64]|uniref:AAA family ATPase n=1 Tax=Variovorax sp. DT-64 TaxID=3396160 RepID=UPI003F1D276F